jgi:glycerol uptake facilitator-like aquaporin
MGGATCGALAIKGLANPDFAKAANYGANAVAEGISVGQAFGLELIGTACLLFVVYGTAVDPKVRPSPVVAAG